MKRTYNDCFFCGGAVEEQLINREVRWEEQLIILENVPTGVCKQCGEKVVKPDVAHDIDALLQGKKTPQKMIQVPVYSFVEA